MAGEIQLTTKMAYANGSLADPDQSNTLAINQNAAGILKKTLTVANTETDVDLSAISTLGYFEIQHVSNSANYLRYGPKNTNTNTMAVWGRLYQGERAIFRADPSTTLRWIAVTNSIQVLLRVLND
jgi:hypothetical protein